MQIKRFEAPEMQQVLCRLKEAPGPEVIILSTEALKKNKGRTWAFFQMAGQVMAGIDHPPANSARPARKVAPPWIPLVAEEKESFSPSEDPFFEPMLWGSRVAHLVLNRIQGNWQGLRKWTKRKDCVPSWIVKRKEVSL